MSLEVADLRFSYRTRKIGGSGMARFIRRETETVEVLRGVNLTIRDGDNIVAILGKNGAGKTTLIKLIAGLIRPQSGVVTVDGFHPFQKRRLYLRELGVIFGHKSALWPELSVLENIKLMEAIYQKHYAASDIERYLSLFGLASTVTRAAKTLSLGQSVKANLLIHLLNRPLLLILDEPTVGLDVESQLQCREILNRYSSDSNSKIIITSHNMMDIVRTCSKVYFLSNGLLEPVEYSRHDDAAANVGLLEGLFK